MDDTSWMNYREPKTKKEFIQSLTIDREFQLVGGRWVSGGIGHLNLPELKQIYAGSRRLEGKKPELTTSIWF